MERHSPGTTVTRNLDTDRGNPTIELVEIVAELEEEDPSELTPMYGCVDHVIDNIFSTPPAAEANLRVEFDYEGFRISVDQSGSATLRNTE